MWKVEQVAQLVQETADEVVHWHRQRDGSLHADYRGEALILQRQDNGAVILTAVMVNAPDFAVLAESLHPEYADVFTQLWNDANAAAS
jgi:hypothetical protein